MALAVMVAPSLLTGIHAASSDSIGLVTNGIHAL